jgi:hypothetical protein
MGTWLLLLQEKVKQLLAGFALPIGKKYRRSPINGFIGFLGKFLGQKIKQKIPNLSRKLLKFSLKHLTLRTSTQ